MRIALRSLLVALVLGLGWTIGYGQRPEPEFMLRIDAPVGATLVECVSGCRLVGGNDLGNPNAGMLTIYQYMCSGAQRCGARVGGWLVE